MKGLKLIAGSIIIGLLFTSCEKENEEQFPICDQTTIISQNEYNTAPSDQLNIISVELNDDCLIINFASGGCSGDSWEVKLIDSGAVLYSDPPQRNLRLSLKNQELCEAYIVKEITFDIRNLQVTGNQILLNITNSGDQILYKY